MLNRKLLERLNKEFPMHVAYQAFRTNGEIIFFADPMNDWGKDLFDVEEINGNSEMLKITFSFNPEGIHANQKPLTFNSFDSFCEYVVKTTGLVRRETPECKLRNELKILEAEYAEMTRKINDLRREVSFFI